MPKPEQILIKSTDPSDVPSGFREHPLDNTGKQAVLADAAELDVINENEPQRTLESAVSSVEAAVEESNSKTVETIVDLLQNRPENTVKLYYYLDCVKFDLALLEALLANERFNGSEARYDLITDLFLLINHFPTTEREAAADRLLPFVHSLKNYQLEKVLDSLWIAGFFSFFDKLFDSVTDNPLMKKRLLWYLLYEAKLKFHNCIPISWFEDVYQFIHSQEINPLRYNNSKVFTLFKIEDREAVLLQFIARDLKFPANLYESVIDEDLANRYPAVRDAVFYKLFELYNLIQVPHKENSELVSRIEILNHYSKHSQQCRTVLGERVFSQSPRLWMNHCAGREDFDQSYLVSGLQQIVASSRQREDSGSILTESQIYLLLKANADIFDNMLLIGRYLLDHKLYRILLKHRDNLPNAIFSDNFEEIVLGLTAEESYLDQITPKLISSTKGNGDKQVHLAETLIQNNHVDVLMAHIDEFDSLPRRLFSDLSIVQRTMYLRNRGYFSAFENIERGLSKAEPPTGEDADRGLSQVK